MRIHVLKAKDPETQLMSAGNGENYYEGNYENTGSQKDALSFTSTRLAVVDDYIPWK